jgi:hypothetical protein
MTLSDSFVNQEMFYKYTFPIFKQNVGFQVECLPPLCGPVLVLWLYLRIAVNPTTGACIPLAPETVFSNVLYL